MMNKLGILMTALLSVIVSKEQLTAQILPRQYSRGLVLANLSSALLDSLKLNQATNGVYVLNCVKGSTPDVLKIKAGDIITKINDIEVKKRADTFHPSLRLHEGDKIIYEIIRNGEKFKIKGTCLPIPYEQSKDLKIEYSSIPFKEGKLRCISTSPKNNLRKPTLLFIPGYPCVSIDNLSEHHPYKQLIYGLAKEGNLVIRMEKSGIGDSQNTPDCNSIDFNTEVEAFRSALKTLRNNPEVDTNNIFVLGHSMGGMEAPFICEGEKVKGIIVMGVTVKSWLEYLTEMIRVQNPNFGISYEQTEKDLKTYETLLYELLVNKKKPTELINQNKEYVHLLKRDFNYKGGNDFLTRDIIFSQSLNDIQIVQQWAKVESKVLSIWGEYDIQTLGVYSHQELVKIVNAHHPGNASFLELKSTDHNFIKLKSMEESYKRTLDGNISDLFETNFNGEAVKEINYWIKSNVQ